MTDLATTLANLAKRKTAQFRQPGGAAASDRLQDLGDFDANPGGLRGRMFVPDGLPFGAALVVVLHGCTQTAADYDRGAGWSQLAEAAGFALLFPEQRQANNQNLCFNWFSPVDQRRGSGEAQSIRSMVASMVAAHGIDERRIFITGLSAGGAMAAIMLATYPYVFAGGAIIAGLPFGCARSVAEAFARMRGDGYPPAAELEALVRHASGHRGPWPTLSVWQGSADNVVDASNADRIVAQWQGLHDVAGQAPKVDRIDGSLRRQWRDRGGRSVIESWTVDGMGHGTPIATRGADACGVAGPYMLDAGISSTRHIARGWGLAVETGTLEVRQAPKLPKSPPVGAAVQTVPRPGAGGVGEVIENALRSAGLMR